MPRINPTVSKEAAEIYDKMPHHERGKYVSDAIIEKKQRESGTGYITQEELNKALDNHIKEYHRKDD